LIDVARRPFFFRDVAEAFATALFDTRLGLATPQRD